MGSSRISTLSVVAIVVGLASRAGAAPPPVTDPVLEPWFRSLHQPGTGLPCCSIADCRITSARDTPWGYETLIDDKWIVVPRERVLGTVTNPTGHAVVCYRTFHDENMQALPVTIFCFVRPPES
jgi:hypothetical protein